VHIDFSGVMAAETVDVRPGHVADVFPRRLLLLLSRDLVGMMSVLVLNVRMILRSKIHRRSRHVLRLRGHGHK